MQQDRRKSNRRPHWNSRDHMADNVPAVDSADWLVVGAGPVGTLAVATVLRSGNQTVFWVDPCFECLGRLGMRYSSVPANTRTDRVLKALRALPALSLDESQNRRKPTRPRLIDEPPLGTAALQLSIDALRDGSAALRKQPNVRTYRGAV